MPDPTMPLRLLSYVTEIFAQHQKAHGLPLLPVIPLVLHQGPDAWTTSTAFEDLFDLPQETAADLLPFLPKFHHALLDLTRFDPDTEDSDTRLRVVLQLMKLARQKELLRFFHWLAGFPAHALPDHLLSLMLLSLFTRTATLTPKKFIVASRPTPNSKKTLCPSRKNLKQKVESRGFGLVKFKSLKNFWIYP